MRWFREEAGLFAWKCCYASFVGFVVVPLLLVAFPPCYLLHKLDPLAEWLNDKGRV